MLLVVYWQNGSSTGQQNDINSLECYCKHFACGDGASEYCKSLQLFESLSFEFKIYPSNDYNNWVKNRLTGSLNYNFKN